MLETKLLDQASLMSECCHRLSRFQNQGLRDYILQLQSDCALYMHMHIVYIRTCHFGRVRDNSRGQTCSCSFGNEKVYLQLVTHVLDVMPPWNMNAL